MKTYRLIPAPVQAVQHTGSPVSATSMRTWVGKGCDDYWSSQGQQNQTTVRIHGSRTKSGKDEVAPGGSWVLRHPDGRFSTMSNREFTAAYEEDLKAKGDLLVGEPVRIMECASYSDGYPVASDMTGRVGKVEQIDHFQQFPYCVVVEGGDAYWYVYEALEKML